MNGLDRIDYAILRALLDNGRQSQMELSHRVPLSPTACARRVKRLEEEGVIRGYRAELDGAKLACGVTVFVHITLGQQSGECLNRFEDAVRACPSVVSCHLMSGADDYLLWVAVRDIADYERIHKEELSRLPHVSRIQSSFALREITRRPFPPRALNGASG